MTKNDEIELAMWLLTLPLLHLEEKFTMDEIRGFAEDLVSMNEKQRETGQKGE